MYFQDTELSPYFQSLPLGRNDCLWFPRKCISCYLRQQLFFIVMSIYSKVMMLCKWFGFSPLIKKF